MKKFIVILSCVLLIAALTLTSVFATAGAASATLTASSTTVEPGTTVVITGSLENIEKADSLSVVVTLPDGVTAQSHKWLDGGFLQDFNYGNHKGVWGTSGNPISLKSSTVVFQLTCLVGESAVGTDAQFKMAFKAKYNNDMVAEVDANVTVKVVKYATGVSLNKQTLSLDLSGTKTAQLTATVTPANTTDACNWTSSNPQVATVDSNGNVTALAEGQTTITVTAGTKTATCNVSVTCGHSQKTETAAKDPTCKDTGNNKYFTCKTCGDVFKADGTTATTVQAETLATVNHKGGTASCSAMAKCQWCNQPYGDTLPHTFTEKVEDANHLVSGSGANCQQMKKYFYDCANCDAIATTEQWESSTPGNHKMETSWTTEGGQHYHKCSITGCTHKEDVGTCSGGTATCQELAKCGTCNQGYGAKAEHAYTAQTVDAKYLKSVATCKDKAVYVKNCYMCGLKDTNENNTFENGSVDASNHTGGTEIKDAVAGNCGVDGFEGNTWCKGCNTKIKDGKVIPATGNHTGGTATCTAKAVCTVCSKAYGETKPHPYSATWTSTGTSDSDKHYQLCSSCGVAKKNEGTHQFTWVTDVPATEDETGIKHEECATCKVKRSENTVIDKQPHKHIGITRVPAKAATCISTGNVEYWICSSHKCTGKFFGDANCNSELTQVVTPIDSNNHSGTEVREAKQPTCYQEGYSGDTYCTGCGIKLKTGVVLKATEDHKGKGTWLKNDTQHWQECTTSGCTAKVNLANHTYQWKLDKAATEDVTGLKHEECVCGIKRNEGTVIPKLDHKHVSIKHVDAVKATCVKAGTVEYWTCGSAKCAGKYYGDSKCQLELSTIVEAINKNNHTGGTTLKEKVEATCSQSGYSGDTWCNSCKQLVKKGVTVAPTGKHTPTADYSKDENQHWKVCAVCGDINGYRKEAHTYKWVIDKAATEETTGLKHQVCTACGYETAKDTVVDKLVHSPAHVDGKACTCTEDGVLEHYLCANCGRYYASANGQIGDEITKDETVLKATGHTFGTEWKTDEKEHWHVCACGEAADKAAHTIELVGVKEATLTETGYSGDEVCTVCDLMVAEGQETPVVVPEPEKSAAPIVIAIVAAVVVAAGGIGFFLFKKRKA